MGAVPKKKPSKHQTRTRRTAWLNRQKLPRYQNCKNCDKLKLPHRVCPHCGYLRDKKVIEIKAKNPKDSKV
ncbi:50S ribosomal protein L32 [Patescibacteria group bacterium]|nr:50S ribosomal protein L32 [Patescibacteria group bacterium]MBU1868115.1 50S ribosomal protein L32 [Patescibacteria group bacterium]